MALKVEVSVGELLDKITILEIKSERIDDPAKLVNVRRELELLRDTWNASPLAATDVAAEVTGLKTVNEELWEIEDDIRRHEAAADFGESFVKLARSVYHANDRRAALKKDLNLKCGSTLVEEKSYVDYSREKD
ncbi:hypothetical protein DRQ50_06900 [bacterium]|nr:MAG: hypothetical protein DRQ50_06900 [bacterium]